jgi:hypothetical protein
MTSAQGRYQAHIGGSGNSRTSYFDLKNPMQAWTPPGMTDVWVPA